jgi:hypothetical protein
MAWLRRAGLAAMVLVGIGAAQSQGTVTFDGASGFAGTSYSELGMGFRVVMPTPGQHDDMGVGPAITGPSNVPYNSTPYMIFQQFYSPNDYVSLSLTNGSAFGLTSVQLADPNSPSYSLLPISFVGFKAGGLTVTNTFTTPGGGADHLLSYQFAPSFASGLLSVDIQAPRWAMDNLVWVPEPSTVSLLGLGALALLARQYKRRRRL